MIFFVELSSQVEWSIKPVTFEKNAVLMKKYSNVDKNTHIEHTNKDFI